MLFLENLIRVLLIFNGLRSRYYQQALLGYLGDEPMYPMALQPCRLHTYSLRFEIFAAHRGNA